MSAVAVNESERDKVLRALEDMDCLTLSFGQVRVIRNALLVGLSALNEVERVEGIWDMAQQFHGPEALPKMSRDLRPLHPTGAPATAEQFCESLRFLECWTH